MLISSRIFVCEMSLLKPSKTYFNSFHSVVFKFSSFIPKIKNWCGKKKQFHLQFGVKQLSKRRAREPISTPTTSITRTQVTDSKI